MKINSILFLQARILLFFSIGILMNIIGVSCKHDSQKEWQVEKDSLENINRQQREVLDEMTTTIVEIAAGLDSISRQENLLTLEYDNEGRKLGKKKMIENLTYFENLLAERREKMKQMEILLSERDSRLKKMAGLINYLNEELDKKEATIRRLKTDLENKNMNLKRLNKKVVKLNDSVAGLADSVAELQDQANLQKQVLSEQEDMLNIVYYIIGTKKELMAKGILTWKGLFSKANINTASLDRKIFQKYDRRFFNDIEIQGNNPKLLSNMPVDSYLLVERKEKSYVLKIIDSEKFWSFSKLLIIQIK